MKTSLIFIFLSITFLSNSQEFKINGDFEGTKTDKIFLQYINQEGEYVRDTLKIQDGKFTADGKIKGTQRVFIIGNTEDNSMEDPNLGYFFLEPKTVKLTLKEDNFKNLKVVNSPTQLEFENINKKSLKFVSQGDSLSKANAERDVIMQKFEEIKNLELNYASRNPSSFLNPYYVSFYMRQLDQDVLRQYFNKMSEKNRNSVYGQQIKELLNSTKIVSSDKAPDFNLTDLKGNNLSMEKFSGKYLLIDFWAGWCIPCVKQLPELKVLSKKFKNKDFEILGVSFDQNKEEWKKSVIKHETQNWNHVYIGMENIRKEGSLSEKYDIQPIPAYILIDKEGRIIDRYLNASNNNNSFKDLTLKLEELMAK